MTSIVNLGPASCTQCSDYLEARRDALAPHVAAKATRDSSLTGLVWLEFMRGVHERHLSGLSILPAEVSA